MLTPRRIQFSNLLKLHSSSSSNSNNSNSNNINDGDVDDSDGAVANNKRKLKFDAEANKPAKTLGSLYNHFKQKILDLGKLLDVFNKKTESTPTLLAPQSNHYIVTTVSRDLESCNRDIAVKFEELKDKILVSNRLIDTLKQNGTIVNNDHDPNGSVALLLHCNSSVKHSDSKKIPRGYKDFNPLSWSITHKFATQMNMLFKAFNGHTI